MNHILQLTQEDRLPEGKQKQNLVGGLIQPLWTNYESKWESSPSRGWTKKKYLKPPIYAKQKSTQKMAQKSLWGVWSVRINTTHVSSELPGFRVLIYIPCESRNILGQGFHPESFLWGWDWNPKNPIRSGGDWILKGNKKTQNHTTNMTTYDDFWGILWRMKAELLPTDYFQTKKPSEFVKSRLSK